MLWSSIGSDQSQKYRINHKEGIFVAKMDYKNIFAAIAIFSYVYSTTILLLYYLCH